MTEILQLQNCNFSRKLFLINYLYNNSFSKIFAITKKQILNKYEIIHE